VGTFATVTLPVDLTKCRGAAAIAYEAVATYPGTRAIAVDEQAATVAFELHFPGNLSGLVKRLRANQIPVGERARISLPVRSLAPELIADGPAAVAERLESGTEVWDVQFPRGRYVFDARMEGDRIEASIAPSTSGMHQIYDALLSLALVADGPVLAAG
jgi:hypothetical protein